LHSTKLRVKRKGNSKCADLMIQNEDPGLSMVNCR
jgi:hypothetical protein